jgi:ribonuclease BN (tRNA processing enzyme)
MRANMDRRAFLAGVAALAGTAWLPGQSKAQSTKTRLILLGTGGGPRPRKANSASAQVIMANDMAYVVDCGDGVARQLAFAGVPLSQLRHIFITHHHSDHNADYGNLLLLAWTAGLRSQVAPLVHVHELTQGGLVMQDEHVKVTSTLVHHPPVVPAFGYRFDAADRSIVISGDTAPSDNLIQLAQGADVLVHDALYVPGVERLVARVPNAPALKQSILSHHTSAEDAGRVAQAAGVKLLVLSHLVPPDDPAITEQMWIDAARVHFQGPVIVGKDLLEL